MSYLNTKKAVALGLLTLVAPTTARPIDECRFAPEDIIVRDVAVIGGGASGSHAAVRIRDSKKTVVVIETKDRLGGHVDTYTDPRTGYPVDYGVLAYMALPGVKDFFARFGIPTVNVTSSPFPTKYVDLRTGKPVAGYPAYSAAEVQSAMTTYALVGARYNDLFFPGYFGLAQLLASNGTVPEDLTMPFGQFVAKYGIEAAVPTIWTFASGLGDLLACPTLFVFQNLGPVHLQQLAGGGFFRTDNNSALYDAVAKYLGPDDVMFGSRVAATDRNATGVRLLVKGPGGRQKLVKAKRLLITIPPTKDAMYQFDADAAENELLSKWTWSSIHAGLLTGSNLPDNVTITNTDPSGDAGTLHLPRGAFVDPIAATGIPGVLRTMVVAPAGLGVNAAKQLVRAGVKAMGAAGTFAGLDRIDFPSWSDHSPSQLRVSGADLAAGFYSRLYALQGQRSTFFTGAAWTSDYTSILWVFNEAILPNLLAGL